MSANVVTVDLNGRLINVDAAKLRAGDLVVVQTGDIVPADLRLIEARALELDEFEVTGELLPVIKSAKGDASVYAGSRVARGAGKGMVLAAGEQTEFGRTLSQGRGRDQPHGFRWLRREPLWLALLSLPAFAMLWARTQQPALTTAAFLLLTIVFSLLLNDGLQQYWLTARAAKRLGRANIQVREASALARLGDVDILCFDKTGVLTTRRLEVRKVCFADQAFDAAGGWRSIEAATGQLTALGCALGNDLWYYEKAGGASPVDKALLALAEAMGVDVRATLSRYRRVYDKPFESESRFMACGFEAGRGERCYFAKGDPEIILRMCHRHRTAAGTLERVDLAFWSTVAARTAAMMAEGDTPIALAYKWGAGADEVLAEYTFLCVLQLRNCLANGAPGTIQALARHGIRSLLLTGDKAPTAVRVGADSGITAGPQAALTGRMMERMQWAEVGRQAEYCSVFAHLTPAQKGALVRQLQQAGHRVAMVGDGPNDAIALKAADVGITFANDSSPIAQRLSGILMMDLADLADLVDGAATIKKRRRQLKRVGIALAGAALLQLYVCAFLA